MNRPVRTKLYQRRRQVANDALKGGAQAAIARHMIIPQATVSRDLAAMCEFWREDPVAVTLMRIKAHYAHNGA
jgi:hypothetical protein